MSIPDGSPGRAASLYEGISALLQLFFEDKQMALLDGAIDLFHDNIGLVPEDDPERSALLTNAGAVFGTRFSHTRMLVDIDESIRLTREAIEITDNIANLITLYDNLSRAYQNRFNKTGKLEDMNDGIEAKSTCIAITPEDHPQWPAFMSELGSRLGDRFARTGQMTDLEDGIQAARQAVEAAQDHNPGRARCSNNLGTLLSLKFKSLGAKQDLNESIHYGREALSTGTIDQGRRIIYLSNLGNRLGFRFEAFGHMQDLEEAIQRLREAAHLIQGPVRFVDRRTHCGILSNLALQLRRAYEYTRSMEFLEDAISETRNAIKVTRMPDDETTLASDPGAMLLGLPSSDLGSLLANLAGLLNSRPEELVGPAEAQEAIRIAEEAVDNLSRVDPLRVIDTAFNNLGGAFYRRFAIDGASKDESDLGRAIEWATKAIETSPTDHPERASWLMNLGGYLQQRYARSGSAEDLDRSIESLSQVVLFEGGRINTRIVASRKFLSAPGCLEDRNVERSYTVARAATRLISSFASSALRPEEMRFLLHEAVGVASDCAAIALHMGRGASEALKTLEMGRGVIASSVLDLRTDASLLRQKHPELAKLYDDLRSGLDAPGLPEATGTRNAESASLFDRRQRAGSEMARLLETIRKQDGFEQFLVPATEAQMRAAASHGPIVYINMSIHRCDALIIEESGVRALELPRLTWSRATEHVERLQSPETLIWLWDAIVEPILEELGFTGPPGDAWPRVWWIPTGPLVRFPFHAAGRHFVPGHKTCLDRVISSYNASIKGILHSHQRPNPNKTQSNVVLVSMGDTPELGRLQHAESEVDIVEAICLSVGLPCERPAAAQEDVLNALRSCRVFHFAGHGSTRTNPLQSSLLLGDWKSRPLTVESILDTNLSSGPPFLAYLSACRTGRVENEWLADEHLHVTSAFQLAGFRHVVGTLWDADDALCEDMAERFYGFVSGSGFEDGCVSEGLHRATRSLRDEWIDEQKRLRLEREQNRGLERTIERHETAQRMPAWVPYVHFGV
ncbi:TPR domain containing protein [Colletotrichum plurivorum]|uniref:TPR domain containing protein n=1 Tax=Colletotrichum plurivorum TaxID=2175906 RepID=A0A8H6KPR1_9PEZI|nr:TPR domain containing protein [Colletotrichum plurivorum]